MSNPLIRTEVDALPDIPRKGRGAVSNRPSGRFDSPDRIATDDGWGDREAEEWESAPTQTILGIDTAKHIITRNKSPDIGFDRSINPYKGCEHGCIYCFARPTHAYLNLSPGLDFETRIFRKPDAPELLRAELSAKNYTSRRRSSSASIPMPISRSSAPRRLTRRILEVLAEFAHPVGILTKSALIQRDIDISGDRWRPRGWSRPAFRSPRWTAEMARIMEPSARRRRSRRIETIQALKSAGIPSLRHVGARSYRA